MLMLVTYDISTQDSDGRRRLRRIARHCQNYGQRVQYSVFECQVNPALWTALRARLLEEMDPAKDSLRFYRLGANWRPRIEHVGTKRSYDPEAPLVM